MTYESQRLGCQNVAAIAQGTTVFGNVSCNVNLSVSGTYCSETGGGSTTLLDDHTTAGTITAPGFELAVNQRRRFEIIASSRDDASSSEDWINNRLTIGSDVYQWTNASKHRSFTNGRPAHIDSSAADIEWRATGAVLKNGAVFATYQYHYHPADIFVKFLLIVGNETIELEYYRR